MPSQTFSHNVPPAGQIYSFQGNNLNTTIHEANNLGPSLGNMESSAGSSHADGNNGDWPFNWRCIQTFADKHKRFILGIVKISTVLITIGVSSTALAWAIKSLESSQQSVKLSREANSWSSTAYDIQRMMARMALVQLCLEHPVSA
jgi:hypothetical protein